MRCPMRGRAPTTFSGSRTTSPAWPTGSASRRSSGSRFRRRAGSEQVHARDGRARQGRRGHRRDRLGLYGSAAGGRPVHRAVPVPRGALAVVLGRPAGEAVLLLRLRGGRGRVPLRAGEGGARFSGGGRGARRALRGGDRARERGSQGGGGAKAAGAARRVAGADRAVLRELSVGGFWG